MKKGFTLIELLVVISIIAILSAIGLAVFGEVQKGARDARRKQDLRSIQTALEIYYQKNSNYPLDLNAPFSPTYIDTVPTDPINAAPFIYSYQPATGVQCYALVATLEKQTDPERNAIKQYKNCDGTLSWTPGSTDAFVITSQD